MTKLVRLKLNGSFPTGYNVTLEIGEEGQSPELELNGALPSDRELLQALETWHSSYRSLDGRKRIKAKPGQLTNVSLTDLRQDCRDNAQTLRNNFNHWLDADAFRPLKEKCLEWLNPRDEVRLLLRTTCPFLPQLPWHQWELVERYERLEIALSPPDSEKKQTIPRQVATNQVKILAILGNSEGIDVEEDRRSLEKLPGAKVTFLEEPSHQTLSDRLWEKPWDILFFSGHSETHGETGLIHLNATESLTVTDLKEGLKKAIRHGLQLAIFNSCDGLGLAWELQTLHLPQLVVMGESVPDLVAQQFLQYFLKDYADGISFYLAVNQARKKLQGLEADYPCASWLPLIVQNAATIPPTWQDLRFGDRPTQQKRYLKWAVMASVLITGGVLFLAQGGWLQFWELKVYDHLMGQRLQWSPEPLDPRLLIVTITESDLDYQNRQGSERNKSLSDAALAKLLSKLVAHQPRVIGLDMKRDYAIASSYRDTLEQTESLIGICAKRTAPAPEIAAERIGFADIFLDRDDILRRSVYGINATQTCPTTISFSLLVALHYLAEEGIGFTPQTPRHLGKAFFPPWEDDAGGYHLSDAEARGKQMLLNYRANRQVAQQVTLEDVLSDRLPPEQIKDRIVLIGTVAQEFRDYYATPYDPDVPGIVIHAQMVSQFLSAALDGRPMITYWTPLGEGLWTWLWGLIGGLLAWYWRSPLKLGLAAVLGTATLYGLCYIFLVQGVWVIFVAPWLAGFLTGGTIVILRYRETKTSQTGEFS